MRLLGRMSVQLTSYQLWIRPDEYPTAEMYSSLPKKPQNIMDANKENDKITNLLYKIGFHVSLWHFVAEKTIIQTICIHCINQYMKLTKIFTVSLTFCIKVRYNMHCSVVVVEQI